MNLLSGAKARMQTLLSLVKPVGDPFQQTASAKIALLVVVRVAEETHTTTGEAVKGALALDELDCMQYEHEIKFWDSTAPAPPMDQELCTCEGTCDSVISCLAQLIQRYSQRSRGQVDREAAQEAWD